MKTLIAVFSLLLAFASCQPVAPRKKESHPSNKLSKISWLLGNWETQTESGSLREQWQSPSDSALQWQGISYIISFDGDTAFTESIRLSCDKDKLTYAPVVTNQNDGKEVPFSEKTFSDSLVVFENLNHDFPQRIIYKRISDTSILAAIEGVQNGQNRREEFAYSRR